jgi:hypothetical protein
VIREEPTAGLYRPPVPRFLRSNENSPVELVVLHIADCPNWEEAGGRLRDALMATGHPDAVITYRLLRTTADADGTAFASSPTIEQLVEIFDRNRHSIPERVANQPDQ